MKARWLLISIVLSGLLLWGGYTATLISSAQTLTTSFVDFGGEINCQGYRYIILYIQIDQGDADDIQIRALHKHTAAGSVEYYSPILTIGSSAIKVESEYAEFNVDEDKPYRLVYDLTTTTDEKWVQFQIRMATDGGTDGVITTAYYTKSN